VTDTLKKELLDGLALGPVRRWFAEHRWGCLLIPLAILLWPGLLVYVVSRGPRVGEHVTAAEARIKRLPDEAADVCYAIRAPLGPNTAYEFTISEEGFRQWAGEWGWDVEEIGDDPVLVYRYARFAGIDDDSGQAVVSDGLAYEWRDADDPDVRMQVVYDRERERAYYWFQAH
jgi:hypothetical protein